jgi:hypothetical protein
MTDLAAIVARDREWIEQDGRLVYTWINVRSGERRVAEHATDPDGPADRRALLALLRETREALLHQAMRRHTSREGCAGCVNVKVQIAAVLTEPTP